ncbi:ABC transporter permease subunit [Agarivorans sp. TSD2052]|uniref:ABC transporter permease n=1 Tax=Agarivorans sp. TSD2052 TaxID=2937286 RepID=UPI00200C0351|nr:ABC transporter permease subunit [Agarivorans sp. TSD2052]UPW17901.1 ABC transporter permease subunit [Agarivorans sp. TSD2052]
MVVFPLITSGLLLLPLIFGFIDTLLPAFGYFPLAGHRSFSFSAWQNLFAQPALWSGIALSLFSGWAATLLSLFSAFWIAMHCYHSAWWRLLEKSLAPFLAIPHAAMAIALLFLLAPSGWIMRWLSPWLTGFAYPPMWTTTQDSWGISLILALWIKELPFLLLVVMGACSQLPVKSSLAIGQSFAYSAAQVWRSVLIPQLLKRIRLPLFAVLVFSLTVVDVAQIIGPSHPATLGLLVWQWFSDSNIEMRLTGAAGALLLLVVVLFSLAGALLLEQLYLRLNLRRTMQGIRLKASSATPARVFLLITVLILALSVLLIAIWSFAWRWRFPEGLPSQWSLHYWQQAETYLYQPLSSSLSIAMLSAGLSLILVVGCLEFQHQRRQHSGWWSLVMYLPLLLPQVVFLFGMQVQLFKFHLDGLFISVVWAHLVFVLPYVYLSLVDNYQSYDQRYVQAAVSLSQSYWRSFWRVKIPMLTKPLLLAFAIGFAVSIAQYLPTLFVGGGRISTLTTEAVALASGGDRRVTAVMVIWQILLPLTVYSFAIIWPKWRYRHHRGM